MFHVKHYTGGCLMDIFMNCLYAFLVGVYEPIVKFAGAGATVPLTGFGYSLACGVKEAVKEYGFMGILMGGLTATSAGIATAVVSGFLMAALFKPGDKT